MFNKNALNTLVVALVLCLVCSVLVSTVAVGLKPMQEKNKLLDRNKNILSAAGIYQPGEHTDKDVAGLFEQFSTRIVNLETDKFVTEQELAAANIKVSSFDQRSASKSPLLSESIKGNDPAGIQRLVKYAKVYVLEKDNQVELVVLPVRGAGLWGMMYGFLVLEGDMNTIRGLSFYEHKETPGLGAKVDTEQWKSQWPGRKAYDQDGDVTIEVVKGGKADDANEIDGLSGATLTTRGVDNLIRFWLGERGFGEFLKNLKAGRA